MFGVNDTCRDFVYLWCFLPRPVTKFNVLGQVSNPRKGFYAVNVFDGRQSSGNTGFAPLTLYAYGLKLDLKYLKMVKKPDYYVEVTSSAFSAKKSFTIGDELKFTVYLKESAEDVSLQLHDSYGMSQLTLNGQDKLQLKPEDKDEKVWSAVLKLESIAGRIGAETKAGDIMVRATILGGKLTEPVWGTINYPFESSKSK
jgi:hypothetical protein